MFVLLPPPPQLAFMLACHSSFILTGESFREGAKLHGPLITILVIQIHTRGLSMNCHSPDPAPYPSPSVCRVPFSPGPHLFSSFPTQLLSRCAIDTVTWGSGLDLNQTPGATFSQKLSWRLGKGEGEFKKKSEDSSGKEWRKEWDKMERLAGGQVF